MDIDLTYVCTLADGPNGSTCTGTYRSVSLAFDNQTHMTVSAMLSFAASSSNSGGSNWYSQARSTQELAKDAFDAINNRFAFRYP